MSQKKKKISAGGVLAQLWTYIKPKQVYVYNGSDQQVWSLNTSDLYWYS